MPGFSDDGVTAMTAADRERFRKMGLSALAGIAPIFRVSWSGTPSLIGTGFWATETGLLITAWHVITDNFDEKGRDVGPIIAIQTTDDLQVIPRTIRRTDKHPVFDLALSETERLVDHDGRAIPTKQ